MARCLGQQYSLDVRGRRPRHEAGVEQTTRKTAQTSQSLPENSNVPLMSPLFFPSLFFPVSPFVPD